MIAPLLLLPPPPGFPVLGCWVVFSTVVLTAVLEIVVPLDDWDVVVLIVVELVSAIKESEIIKAKPIYFMFIPLSMQYCDVNVSS